MRGQLAAWAVVVCGQLHACIDGVEDPLGLHVLARDGLDALLGAVYDLVGDACVIYSIRRGRAIPSNLRTECDGAQLHPLQRHLAVDEKHQVGEQALQRVSSLRSEHTLLSLVLIFLIHSPHRGTAESGHTLQRLVEWGSQEAELLLLLVILLLVVQVLQ